MPRQKPPARREKAERIATVVADKAFAGKKGHGGTPSSYLQMDRVTLMAYLIVAFELGCEWESRL